MWAVASVFYPRMAFMFRILLIDKNKHIFSFFPFKKSEPEIVAFNRIVGNYDIHLFYFIGVKTRELVLTVGRQDRKICNGTANDFSESCLWIFLLFWKRHGKKTTCTSLMYS